MKCPHCGRIAANIVPQPPDTLYVLIRHKRIGFQGTLNDGQLKHFEPTHAVFTKLADALDAYKCVQDDSVYECKRLGTREELIDKEKNE